MPILVIQRGHVPRTTGSTGTAGEQAMARAVAAEVVKQKREGWDIRVIDADPPISAYRGDYFVAVHGDGAASKAAVGASVGYRTDEGKALAQAWKAAYKAAGWPYSFRTDNYTANLAGYYGILHAVAQGNRRAIIIEVGFLTNPDERRWIDANAAAIARSIWDAAAGKQSPPKEEPMPAKNKMLSAFVRPDKVAAAVKALTALGVRVYVHDADDARVTRENPKGTAQ